MIIRKKDDGVVARFPSCRSNPAGVAGKIFGEGAHPFSVLDLKPEKKI
jgi:hypothetical protein